MCKEIFACRDVKLLTLPPFIDIYYQKREYDYMILTYQNNKIKLLNIHEYDIIIEILKIYAPTRQQMHDSLRIYLYSWRYTSQKKSDQLFLEKYSPYISFKFIFLTLEN